MLSKQIFKTISLTKFVQVSPETILNTRQYKRYFSSIERPYSQRQLVATTVSKLTLVWSRTRCWRWCVEIWRQWRSQKLCVGADPFAGGSRIEAPVPSGVKFGEGCPLPSRLGALGECRELPSGVRVEAPVVNALSAYSRPQNASRRKKNAILMQYERLIQQ